MRYRQAWLWVVGATLAMSVSAQQPRGMFDEKPWQCPLVYQKPDIDPFFLAKIEPLIILADESCMENKPQWLDRLHQLKVLRDKFVEIHSRAVNPGPFNVESMELSKQIVDLAGAILVELSPVLENQNMCGIPLDERLNNLVIQTVKTVYSADQHVREVADLTAKVSVLPDAIASVVKRTQALWKESKALKEKRFVNAACEELQRQKQACDLRDSGANALAVVSEKVKSWEPDVRSKVKNFKAASKDALDGKNPWESLKSLLKPREDEPDVLETYHKHVVPMLRMCGMMRMFPDKNYENRPVLNQVKKAVPMLAPKQASTFYEEQCSAFFCNDPSLFQPPDPQNAGQRDAEVCLFVRDYPRLEEKYLLGFVAAVHAGKKGQLPSSYCLPDSIPLQARGAGQSAGELAGAVPGKAGGTHKPKVPSAKPAR